MAELSCQKVCSSKLPNFHLDYGEIAINLICKSVDSLFIDTNLVRILVPAGKAIHFFIEWLSQGGEFVRRAKFGTQFLVAVDCPLWVLAREVPLLREIKEHGCFIAHTDSIFVTGPLSACVPAYAIAVSYLEKRDSWALLVTKIMELVVSPSMIGSLKQKRQNKVSVA